MAEPPDSKKLKMDNPVITRRDELKDEIQIIMGEIKKIKSNIVKESDKKALENRRDRLENRRDRLENRLENLMTGVWICLDGEELYKEVPYNLTIASCLMKSDVSIAAAYCMINNSPLTNHQLTRTEICEITTSDESPLEVLTNLNITCTVEYISTCRTQELSVSLKAKSSVDSLVRQLCKTIKTKADPDNIEVLDGSRVKIDDRTVLVKPLDTHFFFSCVLMPEKQIEAMVARTSPPSKFPENFACGSHDNCRAFEGTELLCHRKGLHGDTVSLYYPGFAEFQELCKSIIPTWEDCLQVAKICNKMQNYFVDEYARRDCFNDLLTKYFDVNVSKFAVGTRCDGGTASYPALVGEYKNEVGKGNCDSYTEGIAYYVQMLENCKTWQHWAQPSFFCELVGPNFMISGIVYGQFVYVDRLDSVWLVTQPNVPGAMEKTVKVLAALKKCVCDLHSAYQAIEAAPKTCSHCLVFPRFPTFQKYDDNSIRYERRLGVHLFCGTVDSKKVLVKFTETYCAEAHQLLEKKNLAPRLHHIRDNHNMKAIVMEYLEESQPIDVYLSSAGEEQCKIVREHCRTALQLLHAEDYVHGDFRPCNILVLPNVSQVRIIDFEWSGKVGEAKYPLFMNHVDIAWPDGAKDGQHISKAHDTHFMDLLCIR